MTGSMEISVKDYGHRINELPHPGAGSLEVPALSIDTIRQRLGWDRIVLLKIDIEGYEKRLFSSECAWLHRVDALCIECQEADVQRIAREFGFLAPSRLPGIRLLRQC